jgi:maltose/moltooligosaccharide transporter
MERPRLSFWQIWNMSFGFLGIQFGWALQMANMSAIFEYLGADAHQIPMLWLAAPLTGLIVQPVIGHMSDHTWNRLGRRRPYFLIGALLASFALTAMPNASALWMAAGLLWVMDASINISMEPFRAFVADLVPPEQRTRGFAMQAASMLPWLLYHFFPIGGDGATVGSSIPFAVTVAFYAGAVVFLAAVLWTIVTTEEYPPADMEAFRRIKAERGGLGAAASEILHDVMAMPPTMRRLAWVQIFTWLLLHVALLRRGGGPEHLWRDARHSGLRAGDRLGWQLLRDVLGGLLRLLVRASGGGRAAGAPPHARALPGRGRVGPAIGGVHQQ